MDCSTLHKLKGNVKQFVILDTFDIRINTPCHHTLTSKAYVYTIEPFLNTAGHLKFLYFNVLYMNQYKLFYLSIKLGHSLTGLEYELSDFCLMLTGSI